MMERPRQSAVIIRWTFMACAVLVFAVIGAMAIISPGHSLAGLAAGWRLLQGHP